MICLDLGKFHSDSEHCNWYLHKEHNYVFQNKTEHMYVNFLCDLIVWWHDTVSDTHTIKVSTTLTPLEFAIRRTIPLNVTHTGLRRGGGQFWGNSAG